MSAVTIEQAAQIAIGQFQAGQFAEATNTCRQILAVQPDHHPSLYLLGIVAIAEGRYREAQQFLAGAVAASPGNASYHSDLGVACHRLGQLEDAIACLRRAITLEPDNAQFQVNLGAFLNRAGDREGAISSYRRALQLDPTLAEAHQNLANLLAAQDKLDEAIVSFRRALASNPLFVEAHTNLGVALAKKDRSDEAIACYQKALEIKPDYAEAHHNLGNALKEGGDLEGAAASYRRTLAIKPDHTEALSNLGNVFRAKADFEEAVRCYRQSLQLDPSSAAAHWNLALALLALGHYEEGLREYEWRAHVPYLARRQRKLSAPRWDGSAAKGKTILLHAEQGLGDTLQFIRYLPMACARAGGARVVIECQAELGRLFASSELGGAEIIVRRDEMPPDFQPIDYHLPLLSLPFALGTGAPTPAAIPYLKIEPAWQAEWRERLGPRLGLRIGLVWAGNPHHPTDALRSLGFEEIAPLLRIPGVIFHSLQVPAQTLPPASNRDLIDLTARLSDFADTAAILAELDLLISVDTAVVHLAGALGRPVWTLLPFLPDWRWGLNREATPWYPTMRLFRQPRADDWTSVIERVARELSQLAQ